MKRDDEDDVSALFDGFLYIDPLKQGLKPNLDNADAELITVFIHRSIKTRIETRFLLFLLQSLYLVFIHRSIKTRIETIVQTAL